jgi:imidazolonepropionase-like amidohydrolase
VLVRAGDLFDSEAGRMVGPRDILIRDGTVAAVERTIAAPAGAEVIDLRACSVLPGLIDSHTHVLHEEGENEDPSVTALREGTVVGEAQRALQGAGRARSYLQAGFTTIRDLGNSGRFLDVALKRAINRGDVPGPRIYAQAQGSRQRAARCASPCPGATATWAGSIG